MVIGSQAFHLEWPACFILKEYFASILGCWISDQDVSQFSEFAMSKNEQLFDNTKHELCINVVEIKSVNLRKKSTIGKST